MNSKYFVYILFLLLPAILAVFPAGKASAQPSLDFIVENETFFKNLEYIAVDEYSDGRTFFGDLTRPYFRYFPTENVTINVGILLDLPFGEDDKVKQVEPVISINMDLFPGFRFTMGTLDRNHQLLDVMFNDDLSYTEPVEQGFQFLVNTEQWRQDTWIDWEVIETSTRREKFSVGNYTQLSYRGFMVDGQIYWVHYGGQRNSGPGTDNNLSLAAGAGYTVYPKSWGTNLSIFEEAGVSVHYAYNRDKPSGASTNTDGSGVLGKAFVRFAEIDLYYQQWESKNNDFPTEKGDPFYNAKHYKELGIEKTFVIGDGIFLTAGFKGQWLLSKFVHTDFLSVTWRGVFPLFEDYFTKIAK